MEEEKEEEEGNGGDWELSLAIQGMMMDMDHWTEEGKKKHGTVCAPCAV